MVDFNKVYANTEKRIDTLLLNSSSMLEKSIKKLEENIVSRSASILDIGKAGNIKAQKELSQAIKFHNELAKEFESTYGSTVQKSSKSFLDVQSTVRNEFKGLDLPYSFGAADKEMFESLRRSAAGGLQHLGDDAMGKIAQATYSAVITGQSFGLFVKNVRDQMGSLGKYAQTRAHDSLMDYYTDLNIKKAGDAGIETFLYYGNIIRASRPFCIARVGMVFTIKQIQEWDKLAWAGKRPGPTLINRGGYNCRHSLHPCEPEWVEDGKVKVQSWWDQKEKMDPKLVARVKAEEAKLKIKRPRIIEKGVIIPDLNIKKSIKEWVGVKESSFSFDYFRTGKTTKATEFRKFIKQTSDPIIKQPHYRGMVLTDSQIKKLSTEGIDLSSVASFTRTKEIAESWSVGAQKALKGFGTEGRPVIFEVKSLKSGVDISKYAGSLTGQQETLTSGRLIIKSMKDDGNFIRIKAIHKSHL